LANAYVACLSFWVSGLFAPLTQRGVCWFWSRAFISHQCFISQSLIQRFVCPSTKIISSRVCAGRLSSYIKLLHSIKDQTSFLFPSVLSPFSWSLYKGCVCFLQRSGRLPGHLNLLSCVQPLIMNLLCCNLQQFAVLACKQVLQAYSRKFTQIPQLSLAADLCSLWSASRDRTLMQILLVMLMISGWFLV